MILVKNQIAIIIKLPLSVNVSKEFPWLPINAVFNC